MMNVGEYATLLKEGRPVEKGFVARTRRVARHVTLSALSLFDRTRQPRFLRLLYCHFVFSDQKGKFERIIRALSNQGTFVTTDTCVDMLEEKREIDGRYYHLSFDDGLRNIVTNALPVLSKLHVPAMIFVPTSLVGADWETAREYCLNTTLYPAPIELADWQDLKESVQEGFEVGSHTRTHANLAAISSNPTLLRDEVAGSKEDIEQKLGVECKYISWTFGRLRDINDTALDAVREAGYRACFGAYRGSVEPGKTNRFKIPRHQFEVHWPFSHTQYFANGRMEREMW
jgi:peptidoglycan/xylan/chitin deacetylase (PgdA/CDA1 family)